MVLVPHPGQQAVDAEGFSPAGVTPENAAWVVKYIEEELDLATAFTPLSTQVPANSIILGVVGRVTEEITTATEHCVGVSGAVTRYAALSTDLTVGSALGTAANQPDLRTAATTICVYTTGTPGAGKIRLTVFYAQLQAE